MLPAHDYIQAAWDRRWSPLLSLRAWDMERDVNHDEFDDGFDNESDDVFWWFYKGFMMVLWWFYDGFTKFAMFLSWLYGGN